MLPKGSNVTVAKKVETKTTTVPMPDKTETKKYQVQVRKFVGGDYQDKPIDRPTTMALGKQLGENRAKTMVRMQAQKEGKTSYDFNGKKEYSGRIETTTKPVTVEKKVLQKPMVISQPIIKKSVNVTKPVAPAAKVINRKQEFKNAPWTDSKKETKGYTSKPNKGSMKVRWKGGKVKVN